MPDSPGITMSVTNASAGRVVVWTNARASPSLLTSSTFQPARPRALSLRPSSGKPPVRARAKIGPCAMPTIE
jgi:hypothetical protein